MTTRMTPSLDRYQIVSPLGEGRLGATYKAFDPRLQRTVAVKLIPLPEGRPDLAEALLQQARFAAQFNNPGLVKIHDFGQSGQWLYLVTDYVPGDNLAQLLQSLRNHNQWLPLAEAVGLVRQLALVLDDLLHQGWAPRGLKAADVKLLAEPTDGLPYRPVLTSLPLDEPALTAAGLPPNANAPVPGYAYWSPEQTLDQTLDPRSLVYALGVLLYELSVGWQPFPANTLADAVRLHAQAVPSPRTRRADLPEPLEAAILKAVDKDPAQRFADPAALAETLAQVKPQAEALDRTTEARAWTESLLVPYQQSLEAAAAAETAAAPITAGGTDGHHAAEGRAFYNFNGTVVDANLVQTSPDGHVGIYVEVPQVALTPGQATSVGVVIANLGNAPDHFSLSLSGVPAGWLMPPLPPTSLPLAAGESRRVTVTIAPPRSPDGAAGRYSLAVRAVSQSQPNQGVEGRLVLTVGVFSQFQCELLPETIRETVPAQLVVRNEGNTSEAYVVNFEDPDNKLEFAPPYINFTVPAGQAGAVNFAVRRRQSRLVGDDRIYPFALRVAASAGEMQKLLGEVRTKALIPLWLPIVALFACCLLAAIASLVYNGIQSSAASTATAIAEMTANAVARQTISAVGTALALTGSPTPTSSATVTPSGTATVFTSTPSDTPLPATPSNTPLPATPSNTPLPATASDTPAPATATPLPPTATFTLAPSNTAPPTDTPAPSSTPAASLTAAPPPAGGRLLFISSLSGQPNIYIMNSDGSGSTPLSNSGTNQNPSWSAAAQRIVFESTRDGNSEIYVMNLDGTNQTRLSNNPGADTAPVWSPNGAHIAFVSNRDGNPEIYVMNADGTGQTRLTNNSASDTAPAWSPDNGRLAFISDRDGNPELYVMNADGSNQKRLTNDNVPESSPTWAPNSAFIAYVRDTGANAEIYLSTADGATQLRLTNNSAADTEPVWSPNSARLAFVSERDGNQEIYVMNADGSAQTRLTNSAGHDDHPLWSPAGDHIAFSSDRDGTPQVYVMAADGTGQTRLTNDGSVDQPAIWLP